MGDRTRHNPVPKGAFMSTNDLTASDTHFAFGRNWASYAELIDEGAIEESKNALLKLIPAERYQGGTFLDIGCGSGLHALAAFRLGVSRIVAVDIDSECVATTRALLSRHDISVPWQSEQISVFDLDPTRHGTFDIVYSWGVLHHTGDMWAAVKKASQMVANGGLLAIALYRSTRFDSFWKAEKRWYAHTSPAAQRVARGLYIAAFRLARLRQDMFRKTVAGNGSDRGMDFYHDVHDWLGGYPYETALCPELDAQLAALGFSRERVFAGPMNRGLFGSSCDEYVYRLEK
jgi:2-polyprenyl-3-methyl-5-hydroxy-6-metoxy-1,4-benzoquinol methylase